MIHSCLVGELAAMLVFGACAEPPATDCARSLLLVAQEDSEPFEVLSMGRDTYPCFAFRAPFAVSDEALRWIPRIDNASVAHHWLLFRTKAAQDRQGYIGECDPSGDATLVMAWSAGGEGEEMPPGVGLELATASDDWFILQLHYRDPRHAGVVDESGVEICLAAEPQRQRAGVMTVGDVVLDIPPRARGHEESRLCLQRNTQSLHVVSAAPHMHRLGRATDTAVLRGGPDGPEEEILAVPSFDYDYQTTHSIKPEVVLDPGDVVRIRCIYDNPSDRRVGYGVTLDDEMCFTYLTVYPIGAFADEARFCR